VQPAHQPDRSDAVLPQIGLRSPSKAGLSHGHVVPKSLCRGCQTKSATTPLIGPAARLRLGSMACGRLLLAQRWTTAWLLAAVLLAAQPTHGLRIGSTLGAYVAPFLAALGPDGNRSHKCRPSQVSGAPF
jgi:hypothetical protein